MGKIKIRVARTPSVFKSNVELQRLSEAVDMLQNVLRRGQPKTLHGKRKRGRPLGSKNKKRKVSKEKSSKDDNSTFFDNNTFTSSQAENIFRSPMSIWNSNTMQFKSIKVPKYKLKKESDPTGVNRRYTKIDVRRFKNRYKKTKQMEFIKEFAKRNNEAYDILKTGEENLEGVESPYTTKDIENLEVAENGHWSHAFSFAVMQAFVKFRSWSNRYKVIEKYMGCIKTSKEIKDHIGQVKRAMKRYKDYEHPYVLYEKTNRNRKSKVNNKKRC